MVMCFANFGQAFALSLAGTNKAVKGEASSYKKVYDPSRKMKAVWLTTVFNLDYPKKKTTDGESLKKQLQEIVKNIDDMGFNTIFFQVRPSSDAFYRSKIFPWSKYLTGTQGVAPTGGFDPLEYIINEAHARNIEVHAWINPYRVAMSKADYDSLVPTHPAKTHPDWVFSHGGSGKERYYFNPGIPAVQRLVFDSVTEIIDNYLVDGIHMDDYFYPGKKINDSKEFEKYGEGFNNIEDWRRDNVNMLVKNLYYLVKAKDISLDFGISPFAIWANKSTNPLGSDTNATQAYYAMYADTRLWVKEGYIDYIMPQIYWPIGYKIADYQKVLNWWVDVTKDTNVKLYVGMAGYKAGSTNPKSAWYGIKEIQNQINLNNSIESVRGYTMFRYKNLVLNTSLRQYLTEVNK